PRVDPPRHEPMVEAAAPEPVYAEPQPVDVVPEPQHPQYDEPPIVSAAHSRPASPFGNISTDSRPGASLQQGGYVMGRAIIGAGVFAFACGTALGQGGDSD